VNESGTEHSPGAQVVGSGDEPLNVNDVDGDELGELLADELGDGLGDPLADGVGVAVPAGM
jgi:hypothetical protein